MVSGLNSLQRQERALAVALQASGMAKSGMRRRVMMLTAMMVISALLLGMIATPSHAQNTRKAIAKEAPAFPSDALDEGISSGSVKARISVAADGSVTKVDILEANPKGVFEKTVTRTLMRWKYEAGAAETIDTLLTFKDR